MKNSKEIYGSYQNKPVTKYSLENENGTKLSVLDYAGIWQEYSFKGHNLLLQPKTFDNFTDNPFFIGRIVGRTSGRIGDSKLLLNGKEITIPSNEGTTNLHGGPNGIHSHFLDATVHENSITLSRIQKSQEDGFPGDLDFSVTYTLFEDDSVSLTFQGTQLNEDGVFNPTSHTYWNLADEQDNILDHSLQILSTKHLQLDDKSVPNGEYVQNANSGFDFAKSTTIATNIDKLQHGIDDVFVIDEHDDNTPIAILKDNKSNRELSIYSPQNGLVVFTAEPINEELTFVNGQGQAYNGIALESHNLPNPDKYPQFGSDKLAKNETKEITLTYKIKE